MIYVNDGRSNKFQIVKEDKIPEETKRSMRKHMLTSITNQEASVIFFNNLKTEIDFETPVARIPLRNQQLNPRILIRLREGLEFYSQSTIQSAAIDKHIEECFIVDKQP